MKITFTIKDIGENVEFETSGDIVIAKDKEPTPAQSAALKIKELIDLMVELAKSSF